MRTFASRVDRRYAKVCLYVGVTVVCAWGAIMLLRAALPVFETLWTLVCAVAEPLVYGAILSYVLNPLVGRTQAWLRRMGRFGTDGAARRRAAVAVTVVAVLVVILAILALLVLMVTRSVASLNWDSILGLVSGVQGDFSKLMTTIEHGLESLGVSSDDNATMLSTVIGVKDVVSNLVFGVIFAIYLLIDGVRLKAYLARVLHALLGERAAVDPTTLLADADRVFSGYFRGQATDACVVGALTAVALLVVGVPYAPVVALLTGLGNLIPYVGGPVGFGSIVLVCLVDAAWGKMLAGCVALALIMFVDANVINPRLLSSNVEVHPMLVIASLIAGGSVGGLAGMLVAVPAGAFLKVQLDRWLAAHETDATGLAPAPPEDDPH